MKDKDKYEEIQQHLAFLSSFTVYILFFVIDLLLIKASISPFKIFSLISLPIAINISDIFKFSFALTS